MFLSGLSNKGREGRSESRPTNPTQRICNDKLVRLTIYRTKKAHAAQLLGLFWAKKLAAMPKIIKARY